MDHAAYPFVYEGPADLKQPLTDALAGVIDPEMALSIVDIGLVDRVTIADGFAEVVMTMTSPACPVADVIVDDVGDALQPLLPADCELQIELSEDPPWTPARMSEGARRFMQG